LNNCEYF